MKKLKKVLGIFCALLLGLVFILAIYNQAMLRFEKRHIEPKGQMVDLGDYRVHVYAEGATTTSPALVFMSGSATVAPVYDFKPLYSQLSDSFRIVIVEKAGYGYSDIYDVPRDIDTMLNEVRNALAGAGEKAPFVLLPHSMSGLEAIYWTQNFPEEVAAIIGIDMAVPESYDDFDHGRIKKMMFLGRTSIWLGFHRIPGFYPLNSKALTREESRQQRLLMYKNAVNPLFISEGQNVYDNAQIIKDFGDIQLPMLLFSSDGKSIGDFWISSQQAYAAATEAKLHFIDGGHYLHHDQSDLMTEMIIEFLIMHGLHQ